MSPPAPHLVDEIIEEIFLRLPTPAALARVSTACPRFRRIITERSFLRRYRKRHPPPLLGFVDDAGGFHPAQAPYPSAPLARALADAADFTCSFVPKPSEGLWYACDVRDGRVLLVEISLSSNGIAVCDPLSRRYVLLPPTPGDLTSENKRPRQSKPLLVPVSEDEDETLFKVIRFADYGTELAVFVFSSITEKWSVAASTSWSSLGGRPPWLDSHPFGCRGLSCFVGGCFYLASPCGDKLLVLELDTLFSTVNNHTGHHVKLRWLPRRVENDLARNNRQCRPRPGQARLPRIVVGKEGAIEVFSLLDDNSPNGLFYLYHSTQQNNGESSKECQLENIVPLPGGYNYFTVGADEGFLFLGATTEDQLDISRGSGVELLTTYWDVDYFSLDVKTSELMKVCRRKRCFFTRENVYWYFGFPPSLSKPSI
ncbi:hypothetical protein CFC21_091636 [Triticum aestivum]|uniref:F-box domain-containing protein n=2 Tax=Triticum aestivum TaxID=4565 RepID=A0A9R1LGR1_WHEAT|nr:hypothetical protein CFC21_091636 [Triticum aestivum]